MPGLCFRVYGFNDRSKRYIIYILYIPTHSCSHTRTPTYTHAHMYTSCRTQDAYCGRPGRVFCTGYIPSCTKPDEPEWYAKLANPLCMHGPKRFQYIIIMVIYKWCHVYNIFLTVLFSLIHIPYNTMIM